MFIVQGTGSQNSTLYLNDVYLSNAAENGTSKQFKNYFPALVFSMHSYILTFENIPIIAREESSKIWESFKEKKEQVHNIFSA
jgi:hypothetical protein